MKLEQAQRKHVKIKLGLQGPSGTGKTMSALLLAYGLCNDWTKIAIIDSENHSAELYSHLGRYNVLNIVAPFSPEKYVEAIQICERSNMEVVIIDGVTPEWEYLLDYHANLPGNSFTSWAKITPRHNSFIQALLQSSVHVISTLRSKSDYVLTDRNGKIVPERVGLKNIQREGFDFEMSVMFTLDVNNIASVVKDRTGLFFGKPEHKISSDTGRKILEWCNEGAALGIDDVSKRINDVATINELLAVYKLYPEYKEILKPEYEQRKRQLIIQNDVTQSLTHSTIIHSNGTK